MISSNIGSSGAEPGELVLGAGAVGSDAPPSPPAPTPPAPAPLTLPTSGPDANIVPTFQMPFSLLPTGRPAICDQGSVQDIASQVLNVLSCPVGANPYDPSFGRPDLEGQKVSLNLAALTSAVQQQVPALASLDAEQSYEIVSGAVQIALTGYIA